MRFPFKFSRRVGAGADPVLGTDVVPTSHVDLAGTNVFRTELSPSSPSQRIAVAYAYAGGGPAPNLSVKGYVYDGTQRTWFTVDSLATTLKVGDISFIPIPQLIDPPQLPAADPYESSPTSVEFALVVTAAGGEPAGTYTFLMGSDISDVDDEPDAGAAAAHVIVDGSALPAGAATEATLLTRATEATLATRSSEATLATRASEATLATRASEATVATLGTQATLATRASEATLATRASEATVATLATEASMLKGLGLLEAGFTTIRTFNNTTSDSAAEPPNDASFVTVGQYGAVEFSLTSILPGNNAGVTSNQVRLRYWARVSTAPAKKWKFYEETIDTAQLVLAAAANALFPRSFNIQCDQVYVTVTFTDGTNPWITSGSIEARPIALQAKDDRTYKIDLATGNPVTQDAAYDALLRALKTARINDLYPNQPDPTVVSEASRITGTHYAPSADGIEMGPGYDVLTIRFAFAGAGSATTENDIEATIDGTNWDVITGACVDATTGLSPTGTSLDSTAGASITKPVVIENAHFFSKYRLRSIVAAGPTGAHTVSFRRGSSKS